MSKLTLPAAPLLTGLASATVTTTTTTTTTTSPKKQQAPVSVGKEASVKMDETLPDFQFELRDCKVPITFDLAQWDLLFDRDGRVNGALMSQLMAHFAVPMSGVFVADALVSILTLLIASYATLLSGSTAKPPATLILPANARKGLVAFLHDCLSKEEALWWISGPFNCSAGMELSGPHVFLDAEAEEAEAETETEEAKEQKKTKKKKKLDASERELIARDIRWFDKYLDCLCAVAEEYAKELPAMSVVQQSASAAREEESSSCCVVDVTMDDEDVMAGMEESVAVLTSALTGVTSSSSSSSSIKQKKVEEEEASATGDAMVVDATQVPALEALSAVGAKRSKEAREASEASETAADDDVVMATAKPSAATASGAGKKPPRPKLALAALKKRPRISKTSTADESSASTITSTSTSAAASRPAKKKSGASKSKRRKRPTISKHKDAEETEPMTQCATSHLEVLLKCCICHQWARQAHSINECLHTYCRECIMQHMVDCFARKTDPKCPGCAPDDVRLGAGDPHSLFAKVVRPDKMKQTLIEHLLTSSGASAAASGDK